MAVPLSLPAPGRVLVGVDVSAGAVTALRWAYAYAARTGADLLVVHAVETHPSGHAPYAAGPAPDPAQDLQTARTLLRRLVEESCSGPGPTRVVTDVHVGPAAQILVELSGDAHLLVVGGDAASRRRHDYLGPVLRTCLHKASCPVVVVPVPVAPDGVAPDVVSMPDALPAQTGEALATH